MPVAFTVRVEVLRALVERVEKIVERRNTIPILSNLALAVEADGRIRVTGTDLDIWAIATAPEASATVGEAGETTVPAALLKDICGKLDKGAELRFASSGTQVTLSSGRSRFKLNELPTADFPDPAEREAACTFQLSAEQLTAVRSRCGFAISTEETRYYLNGVFWHRDEQHPECLTSVATDGHRLALLRIPIAADIAELPGVIIPRKTVERAFDLLASSCGEEELVEIDVEENGIVLETQALRIVSKVIDGKFPDYVRVIPTANDKIVEVESVALKAAVDRVRTVSAERGRGVRCAFAGETLTLSMASPDAGDATDEVTLYGAPVELEIGFNGQYILQALDTFDGARVRLAMNDAGSPAVLSNPSDADRLVVLMPMRV
ncbi:DNA polymerase III subunit beta [Aureimonas mangrovi]|uniref:DNA polymerase III subunit beta n=1 Tax=Aureimonas mangrovi TaxID=2758041 RepID=UPI00163DD78A|nr:DNA polymerase III subunit beta [Aureimonas mangrovi]